MTIISQNWPEPILEPKFLHTKGSSLFLYQDWVLLTQPLFISWSDFEWLQKYHTSLEYTSKRRMLAYNHLKSVSDYFFWHFLTIFSKNTHDQFLTIFIQKIIYIGGFLSTKYSWTTAKLKSKWWTKTKISSMTCHFF